ncbi:MAG: hypothetical protein ACXAB5_00335 [Candidatus Thorarchaeota archaeon]|jgi:hypothetical protein
MVKLSKEAFALAREFIHKNARPLDRALFTYLFEEGPRKAVVQELSKFQNSDGGFGNALEPDFRLKSSSPMATSVGLQYCKVIEASTDEEIVAQSIQYLLSSYDYEHGYWPNTSLEVNNEPHAPWWHIEAVKPPTEESWANPSAELAGYIHRYKSLVPNDFIVNLNRRIQTNVESSEYIDGLYKVMCWERAYREFPEPLQSMAAEKIRKTFEKIAPLKQDDLGEIRILWLAPDSDAILLSYPGNVYNLMHREIERQSDDGGWSPSWKWGQYEDIWPIAEKEWAGKITLDCLRAATDLINMREY